MLHRPRLLLKNMPILPVLFDQAPTVSALPFFNEGNGNAAEIRHWHMVSRSGHARSQMKSACEWQNRAFENVLPTASC
jgi:hypothetical protein